MVKLNFCYYRRIWLWWQDVDSAHFSQFLGWRFGPNRCSGSTRLDFRRIFLTRSLLWSYATAIRIRVPYSWWCVAALGVGPISAHRRLGNGHPILNNLWQYQLLTTKCQLPKCFFPQTGLPVWGSYSFQRVASLGRMILPLSPGLRSTLGALGRMILHLSPACLPLWVLWAAWFYICLLLVFHTCLQQNMLLLEFLPASVSRCSIGLFAFVWGQRWYHSKEMALSFEITIIEWLHELAFQCALLFTFALDFTCRVQAVSSGILFGSSEDVLESPVAGRSARRSCWCSGLNQWILWIVVTWKNQMKSESITHIDASFLRNHLVFSSIWVPALSAVLALAATKTWPCRAARLAFFRDVALAFFCCAPVALLMVNLRCSDPGGQRRPYLWYVYTNQMSQMGLALFVAAAQTLVQAGCHPLVCTVSVLLMTVPTVLMDSDWIFSVAINGELAISPRVGMIAPWIWWFLIFH